MLRPLLVTALALLGTGPGPVRRPDDLVREGNAAARAGDLDRATAAYADASGRAADPGLVAFNRGVVELRRGRHRDAESHFRAALDDRDAPADRRADAEYNLGLALLLRGGAAAVYRAAVEANARCLELSPGPGPRAGDAAHNLELAKLLWHEARDRERQAPPESPPEPDPPADPDPAPEVATAPAPQAGSAARDAGAKPTPPTGPPRATGRTTAGRGTLPVLPDADLPPPLSAQDARAHLQRHAARLARGRAAVADLLAGPERPDGRDW